MKKCVFLDRDGIINVRAIPGYIESWDQFELLPEFPVLLRKIAAMGYVAVVVTNQRGIARGMMTRAAVDEIHTQLKRLLEQDCGVTLLDIMVCPHEKETCACRKPQPTMILDAAAKHQIDLSRSWMIGDTESDVEAGRRAGCQTILVSDQAEESNATVRVGSMADLVARVEDLLEEREPMA